MHLACHVSWAHFLFQQFGSSATIIKYYYPSILAIKAYRSLFKSHYCMALNLNIHFICVANEFHQCYCCGLWFNTTSSSIHFKNKIETEIIARKKLHKNRNATHGDGKFIDIIQMGSIQSYLNGFAANNRIYWAIWFTIIQRFTFLHCHLTVFSLTDSESCCWFVRLHDS